MKIDDKKIEIILGRGVSEIIDKDHLEKSLRSGDKLRIKFGVDPTSPDLHLGHAVPLRKLKQFQDAGHKIVLIIGDFTAQIGDPSERESERKPLTQKEVNSNLKKYLTLAGKIIDIKNTEVRYNSEWLGKNLEIFLEISRSGTIQQLMRRADFKKRLSAGGDITFLEILYPLFQGYDSVAVKADVEIGGTDQKFNLLMGRRVQRHFKVPEQDVVTVPLLEGTDGIHKMSKSRGNYVALDESPEKMFANIMTVPDKLIEKYFNLLTDLSSEEIRDAKNNLPPFKQKNKLAVEIVSFLHSKGLAEKARENFEKKFSKKEIPEDLKVYKAKNGETWIDFLVKNRFVTSKSEAKRLIEGGAIDFDGQTIKKSNDEIKKSGAAKIGKSKFVKIVTKE